MEKWRLHIRAQGRGSGTRPETIKKGGRWEKNGEDLMEGENSPFPSSDLGRFEVCGSLGGVWGLYKGRKERDRGIQREKAETRTLEHTFLPRHTPALTKPQRRGVATGGGIGKREDESNKKGENIKARLNKAEYRS